MNDLNTIVICWKANDAADDDDDDNDINNRT